MAISDNNSWASCLFFSANGVLELILVSLYYIALHNRHLFHRTACGYNIGKQFKIEQELLNVFQKAKTKRPVVLTYAHTTKCDVKLW